MKDTNIIPLFAQPLLEATLPQNFSKFIEVLDKQEINQDADQVSIDNFGLRSSNTFILNLPELKDLSSYILSLVTYFGSNILNHDHSEYKFTQSWISLKPPGSSHSSHIHSNSLISGVFYYGKILKDTPSIGFEPNHLSLNLNPRLKDNHNPLFQSHFFRPTPGTLYIFPSFYKHFVPKNETNITRKSLSFNVVPTDGFGDEEDLTQLKL